MNTGHGAFGARRQERRIARRVLEEELEIVDRELVRMNEYLAADEHIFGRLPSQKVHVVLVTKVVEIEIVAWQNRRRDVCRIGSNL